VIFCLPILQNLVFRLSFSFYNLIFLFCLCNCFGISSSLQFLQFGICVQFLQFFLEWYFVFRFYKIWYFDFPSASAIWYFCSVSAIVLVFCLLFSFCNLVFAFSFCNFFWSDILSSASAIFFGVIFYLPLLQNLVFQLSFSFCHDIYYQRDCLVTLVTCWYKGFLFSSYFYVLWQPEFYSDCSQLGFSWAN